LWVGWLAPVHQPVAKCAPRIGPLIIPVRVGSRRLIPDADPSA
jgi:hypothetical protein